MNHVQFAANIATGRAEKYGEDFHLEGAMITPRGLKRKAAFRAALVMTGKTQGQWATEQGISLGHLSEVLNEKRESRQLIEKIDVFAASASPSRRTRTTTADAA